MLKKSFEDYLLCLESPGSDGVSVLLDAIVDQLKVVGRSGDNEVPEELGNLLMESCFPIIGVPTKLTEAVELLHVKLLNWCVVLDLIQNVVQMHLLELERTGGDDFVGFEAHFRLGEAPELFEQAYI